jgi:hypothetical protein
MIIIAYVMLNLVLIGGDTAGLTPICRSCLIKVPHLTVVLPFGEYCLDDYAETTIWMGKYFNQ